MAQEPFSLVLKICFCSPDIKIVPFVVIFSNSKDAKNSLAKNMMGKAIIE